MLAEVKDGPTDCIRIDEVAAALKKMKRHKAPGLSGLVAEMIQTTGDIGTQWILCGFKQATGYASQHIWCLSQARINWEGCARKGIGRKNGGDGRDGGTS